MLEETDEDPLRGITVAIAFRVEEKKMGLNKNDFMQMNFFSHGGWWFEQRGGCEKRNQITMLVHFTFYSSSIVNGDEMK